MKAIIAMVLGAFVLGGFLGACNTMEGFGQDVQAGGKKIERSADEHK